MKAGHDRDGLPVFSGSHLPNNEIGVAGARMLPGGKAMVALAYRYAGLKSTDPQVADLEIANVQPDDLSEFIKRYGDSEDVFFGVANRMTQDSSTRVGRREVELKVKETDASKILPEAYRRYRMFGVIRSVCLMLRDFCLSGMYIKTDPSKDKSGKDLEIYLRWAKMVGLRSIRKAFFRDHWALGNNFIVPHHAKAAKALRSGGFRAVTQKRILRGASMSEDLMARANQIGDLDKEILASAGVIHEFAPGVIPIAYEFLPPTQISIEGPVYAPRYYVDVGSEVASRLAGMNQEERNVLADYQPLLAQKPKGGKILVPENSMIHIGFDKAPYERIGQPFWWQSIYNVLRKEEMMMADAIMARSGLQSLITVTIGNDTFPAGPEEIAAVAALFLASGGNHTIFWNHTLDVKIHQLDLQLFGDEKYKPINDAILEEMGIPVVLTGGPAPGNYSVGRINVKPTIQMVRTAQDDFIEEFLQPQLDIIREALELKSRAAVVMAPNPLEDMDRLHTVVQGYLDRAVINYRDAVELIRASHLTNSSWDEFAVQQKDENEMIEDGDLRNAKSPYNSPAGGGPPQNGPTGQVQVNPDEKNQRTEPGDGGDRPVGNPAASSMNVSELCQDESGDA